MPTVNNYLDLITSEHRDKVRFVQTVTDLVQPYVDAQAALAGLVGDFDLDTAVGVQLDAIGLWVGRSRYLTVPLTGVYFSWDTDGLGWGEGTWKGPFDPTTGLTALPDDAYRTLLRATIAANQWDGTIPQAYAIWETLFAPTGSTILIQDNGDMTMLFGLIGGTASAVTIALLTGGYLALRPAGVEVSGYLVPSVPDTPIFGWGVDNSSIGGWGHGSWAVPLSPS